MNENPGFELSILAPIVKNQIQNPRGRGVLVSVVTLAVCGALAEAQPQASISKIGFLSPVSDSPGSQGGARQAIRRELETLGYVEGKNIVFESRYADNKPDRLPSLADELVRLKVDALVTSTTDAALAGKNSTRTLPIVFLTVSDPVAVGLVDSLARPGGNITGVTNVSAVLAGKRLELLKETVVKRNESGGAVGSKNSGLGTIVERKPTGRDVNWVWNFIPWK